MFIPGTRRSSPSLLSAAILAVLLATGLSACGDTSKLPPSADVGANPTLPPPSKTLFPTVHIAPATGWPQGVMPQPMAGLSVTALAAGLDHPRWVYVLPNGDVLVAESNKPSKPDSGFSFRGWVMGVVMNRAGAGVPSANRITLLRDVDGDGQAETRTVFLQGLNSPFGMALVGKELFIANADALVKVPYEDGQTAISATPVKVVDLPAGINHHWTKNVIASRDGRKLYVTVGSNSNVGENGMDAEVDRAAILEVDPKAGTRRVFASGLRNPNGLGWSADGTLWTVVNERDEIGSDLVPDYLTSVKEGAFYGWPYSYYGQNVDARVQPQRPDLVAKAVSPDYALGAHVAPLGLVFSEGQALPASLASGVFVGEHGSWNRKPLSGYKVVFVPFAGNKPSGQPVDVLTGFLSPDGKAYGRPVGVAIDKRGALLVADDVGNVIWRVSAGARQSRGFMEAPDPCCVVMTSLDNEAAAETLAQQLVEAQLAACVQVLPIKSFYVWQGESRREAEYLLLIKTRAALFPALETFIRAQHPYDTPELLQLPVTAGSADYLQWLRAGTRGDAV